YEWVDFKTPIAMAPEWLLNLVKDKREGFKQPVRSDTGSRDIDDASLAGYLLNGGFAEDEIFRVLEMRNNDPHRRDVPLPTNELWKTVRSIAKRDVRTPAGLMLALHENSVRVKTEKPEAEPDPLWEERCVRNANGSLKNILANAEAALINYPVFSNSLCYDELAAEVKLQRNLVDPINGKVIQDFVGGKVVDEYVIRDLLIVAQRLISSVTFTEEIFATALAVVARHKSYHPVQDYLHSLMWDENERIDKWLINHLGVVDDEDGYARGVGRRWLISAVSRALKPGCKADCMLIIEGAQGIGKSPALQILASTEWFKDSPIDFYNKDKFSSVRGTWIYELGEFEQYQKQDAATIKNFLSSQYDSYRPPYGRSDIKQARGLVFAGTTNKRKYLVDTTGDKRFWPVFAKDKSISNPVDLEALQIARDQIWAEATRAYYNGEESHIKNTRFMEVHAREAMKRHETEDVWDATVLHYCEAMIDRKHIQTSDILLTALGMPLSRQTNRDKERVNNILRLRGYEYKSIRLNDKVTRSWRKPAQATLWSPEED
ncbi:MAG: VapE domain-containing protein, partial [Candidatus Saccharimonadales bacterium]